MSDKAVLEVIKNQTREYTDLLRQHNTLMKVHAKTVNDFADSEKKSYELRKQNKDLRKILKETQAECVVLQESLDHCQRDLLDATRMDWGDDEAFKRGRRGGGDVHILDEEELMEK